MTIRPWTRVKQGPVQDFTILRIREDTVADPRDGSHHPRVILDCPDWVNIIPVTRDGRVVLIRQFRFGAWQESLEIPGGIVDPGELPEAAAVRELEEETGYRPERVVALGWVHPNPALQGNRCHSYLALDCVRAHGGRQEAAEDITVELHRREDISGLICTGRISHSLVVAAFFLEREKERSMGPGPQRAAPEKA